MSRCRDLFPIKTIRKPIRLNISSFNKKLNKKRISPSMPRWTRKTNIRRLNERKTDIRRLKEGKTVKETLEKGKMLKLSMCPRTISQRRHNREKSRSLWPKTQTDNRKTTRRRATDSMT
jgi:hypothetical protein